MSTATVLQVNLAVPERSDAKNVGITGINKRPVDTPVAVRAPGPKTTGLHSGLVGDQIFDVEHGFRPSVPRRTFLVEVAFRAPERFRARESPDNSSTCRPHGDRSRDPSTALPIPLRR